MLKTEQQWVRGMIERMVADAINKALEPLEKRVDTLEKAEPKVVEPKAEPKPAKKEVTTNAKL